MKISRAISIVKGFVPDISQAENIEAWQALVDEGTVWRMGEPYGKIAACMIEAGELERDTA